jgi:hypothetical protein
LQPSPIIQQYYRILDETQDSIIALEKSPAGGLKQAQSQIQAALDDATALGVYRE